MDLPKNNGGNAGGGQDGGVTAGTHAELNPQEMSAFSEPHELQGSKFDSPRIDELQNSSLEGVKTERFV